MGFAGWADIFQAEIGNLTDTLEYVRAYIDNLLVITRGSLDGHLDILKQVFIQLRNAGLKVNATKSVCAGDRIFRIHPYQRWNLTTAKKGAGNPCAQSTQ
jgi:hypothetical protein